MSYFEIEIQSHGPCNERLEYANSHGFQVDYPVKAIQVVPCRMVITSKMNMRSLRQHGNDFRVRKHHQRVIKRPLVKEALCCQTVRQCLLLRLRRRNWRQEAVLISDRKHHSMKH